jgi:hypothetical protein
LVVCSAQYYLSLCIVGPTEADAQAWAGFVVSRLRKLVSDLLGRSLPVKKIQLWPNKIERCVADKSSLLTQAQRRNSITYFIGFQVDHLRMRGKQLNVEQPLQNFREWELSRFQPLISGMDVLAKTFPVKLLPQVCFEDIYPGGKAEAMKKRRKMRNEDPERQEKKRQQRLEALKAEMAEMEKKKEDRKREEGDHEDKDAGIAVKEESQDESNKVLQEGGAPTEEAAMLEHALDAIQDSNDARTREEAEAERQRLLAGELLGDGTSANLEYEVDDDEEYAGAGEGARQSVFQQKLRKENKVKNIRCLPPKEEDVEFLRQLGFPVVSDDESKVIGPASLPSWHKTEKDEPEKIPKLPTRVRINFLEKFDIVELDSNGHVIDKGDDDFKPSKNWTGRVPGFEFKVGERGLGYYRTGKKVVVPSNTAY